MTYAPKKDSEAARMIAWLKAQQRKHRPGMWTRNCTMARALKIEVSVIVISLRHAVDAGIVERSKSSAGQLQWCITPSKTERIEAPAPTFRTDWPPGFKSQFLTVSVPAWDPKVAR